MQTLETGRLRLRSFRSADVPWLAELGMDPEVRRTTLQPVQLSWIAWFQAAAQTLADSAWVVEEKSTGMGCGWIQAGSLPGIPHLPIGFELRRRFWNLGYMTEAVGAVVQYLFQDQGVRAVSGVVFLENTASQRVFEKNGFTRVRNLDYDGHPCCLFEIRNPQSPLGLIERVWERLQTHAR